MQLFAWLFFTICNDVKRGYTGLYFYWQIVLFNQVDNDMLL